MVGQRPRLPTEAGTSTESRIMEAAVLLLRAARAHVVLFKTLFRDKWIYSMQNFIVQNNVKAAENNQSSIEVMPGQGVQFLIHSISNVAGMEEPKNMVTKAGQHTRCMSLYIEDLERNKMKCTVFGDLVGMVVQLVEKDDMQPLILVTQLFKPSVYLKEAYIQNSRYVSRVLLNPDCPEVIAFKNSLMAQSDAASQPITNVESKPAYSVGDELEGGARRLSSIEDVLNLTKVGRMVSVTPLPYLLPLTYVYCDIL
ncbi:hypothetical protein PIB30_030252 [Stylosanthes scabra]|uniref:Uncharacterized protein n=1 Tax=Stylosanthes scabra TaxID=79078 RepID=A0ABU6X9P2_9FABA|nr:hypothetical protein [Stylosanthes scabra]